MIPFCPLHKNQQQILPDLPPEYICNLSSSYFRVMTLVHAIISFTWIINQYPLTGFSTSISNPFSIDGFIFNKNVPSLLKILQWFAIAVKITHTFSISPHSSGHIYPSNFMSCHSLVCSANTPKFFPVSEILLLVLLLSP